MDNVVWNKCQTPLDKLSVVVDRDTPDEKTVMFKDSPEEVQEQFWDYINNVPFIKWMVSPNRPMVSEIPKDDYGRAIIDVTKPPILEGSDYFRQTALEWEENNGQYTNLKPNANPNSEFGKWIREERRRGWEGYTNPDTGMWVTGDYYWTLNYCPMHLVEKRDDGLEMRTTKHPKFWDGQFLSTHYILQARQRKHHAAYLASRGKGKTTVGGGMLSKRFIIGEFENNKTDIQCLVTAADKTKLIGVNQILSVFIDNIDFAAKNTQFASRRLKSSVQELTWQMGYKKSGSDVAYGSKNSVQGIISGVNQDKLNGSRGVLYIIEEAGIFKDLNDLYGLIRPSVEQGSSVFGEILLYGTAGNEQSDFTAFAEMFYSPDGYNLYGLENVFDKEGQGRKQCCFFYPVYMNYDDSCIDENGNSDVTKALFMILMDRYKVKYGSTDINAITKRISQYPITPQEAIIRSQGNVFPVTELNNRLNQIDNNPDEYSDVYVGELIQQKDGTVEFQPTGDVPIREFPTKDNKVLGALEIYEMPQKNSEGKVPYDRYGVGIDPYDDDESGTMSLGSIFVMDFWKDIIVAERTGRLPFSNNFYEQIRLLCIFYNCKGMYEAHPYSQTVITPEGKKKWKDIKVGDKLFSTQNRIVTVDAIPVDEYMPIYKVSLNDGREILCSDNHIWSVLRLNHAHKGLFNLTTKQMLEIGLKNKHKQNNFFIPNGGKVEFPHQEVPIDPYTMGLLIAEGAFTKFAKKGNYPQSNKRRNCVQFSSSKEDAEFYQKVIPYPIKYIGNKGYSWHMYIERIDKILDQLGLLFCNSYSKHIPELYLYNDSNIRLELLKGLMDGDGCAAKHGAQIYVTTSTQLRDDFMSLCRSLGINCKCVTYKEHSMVSPNNNATYSCHENYHIHIFANESIFKLPRKVESQYQYKIGQKGSKATAYINKTAIVSIEFSHYELGKCISVNTEDGLYMVGDYVVTHNCNLKGTFSYFSQHNCTHLLADTPEYLRDKQLISAIGIGNKAKGIRATAPIIKYGFRLIRDWLLKPVTHIEHDAEGNEIEVTVPNLYNIRCRALIKELIQWNQYGNFDRVMALVQLMLYREEKMILYQGDVRNAEGSTSGMEKDDYFEKNYPGKKK